MKNTFGSSVTVTLFGESHGDAVGVVIDGFAPGVPVRTDMIDGYLARRRPGQAVDTPRREPDNYQIVSGVFDGKTTGTPICIVIPNENTRSGDYRYGLARPAHADYTAFCKYHGFEDYRGGGHFSGRITAALVAAGGIMLPALQDIGITIGTHILRCGDGDIPVRDIDLASYDSETRLLEAIEDLQSSDFPVIDRSAGDKMTKYIMDARAEGDSLGGITQTAICGLQPGIGEPWFDSVESMISHAIFSLGGVKGIEFGKGFELASMRGSESNDAFRMDYTGNNGKVVTETNNNGGINGGITNGMPVIFQCAVKPTPSISKEQKTVDFIKMENADHRIQGRHDPAIIRRICPVIDSVTAIVVCDMLAQRFGTDYLRGA